MFAILLSERMDPFYQNVSSFPTVFFTFFLLLSLCFWLVSVLGLIDIEFLDIAGADLDLGGDIDSDVTTPNAVAGIILKLGLNGVPLSIVISLIALFGWFISYYTVYFFYGYLPEGFMHYVAGVPVLVVSLYVAALVTSVLIRPIRPLFQKMQQHTEKIVLGQVAVVRTSRVDNSFGEVVFNDGGAGLILKVRSSGDDRFRKGDRVVLLEYLKDENVYRVISEEEFSG